MRRQGLLAGAGALAMLLGILGAQCGGGEPAKDPTDPTTKPDDTAPKWDSNSTPSASGKSGGTTDPTARSGNVYDKEATEIVLKRGERQVKENCGHAKDADNKLNGPFGKVTITLVLGHNGHMKEVKVPAPFEGKPPGACIVNSFDNLIFPPWAGADTPIEREVEVVKP